MIVEARIKIEANNEKEVIEMIEQHCGEVLEIKSKNKVGRPKKE